MEQRNDWVIIIKAAWGSGLKCSQANSGPYSRFSFLKPANVVSWRNNTLTRKGEMWGLPTVVPVRINHQWEQQSEVCTDIRQDAVNPGQRRHWKKDYCCLRSQQRRHWGESPVNVYATTQYTGLMAYIWHSIDLRVTVLLDRKMYRSEWVVFIPETTFIVLIDN